MIVIYSAGRNLTGAGQTVLLTLGVPINEMWIIQEIKATSDANGETTITILVNGEEKYKTSATQNSIPTIYNQEISSGAEIIIRADKLGAVAENVGATIKFEVSGV